MKRFVALIVVLVFMMSLGGCTKEIESVSAEESSAEYSEEASETVVSSVVENSTVQVDVSWGDLTARQEDKAMFFVQKLVSAIGPPYFHSRQEDEKPSTDAEREAYYGVIAQASDIDEQKMATATLEILLAFKNNAILGVSGGEIEESGNSPGFVVSPELMERRIAEYFGISGKSQISDEYTRYKFTEGNYVYSLDGGETNYQNIKIDLPIELDNGELQFLVHFFSTTDGLQTKEICALRYNFTMEYSQDLNEPYLRFVSSEFEGDTFPEEGDQYYEPVYN